MHIITLTDMIMNVVGLMQAKRLSEDGWLFELYSISNILSKAQRKRERERVLPMQAAASHTWMDLTRSTSVM